MPAPTPGRPLRPCRAGRRPALHLGDGPVRRGPPTGRENALRFLISPEWHPLFPGSAGFSRPAGRRGAFSAPGTGGRSERATPQSACSGRTASDRFSRPASRRGAFSATGSGDRSVQRRRGRAPHAPRQAAGWRALCHSTRPVFTADTSTDQATCRADKARAVNVLFCPCGCHPVSHPEIPRYSSRRHDVTKEIAAITGALHRPSRPSGPRSDGKLANRTRSLDRCQTSPARIGFSSRSSARKASQSRFTAKTPSSRHLSQSLPPLIGPSKEWS